MVAANGNRRMVLATWGAMAAATSAVVIIIAVTGWIFGQVDSVVNRNAAERYLVSEEMAEIRDTLSTTLTVQVAELARRLEVLELAAVEDPTAPDDTELETRPQTFQDLKLNEHCSEPREVSWRIEAEVGWRIDVSSVSTRIMVNPGSVFHGVGDVSEEGFTLSGRLVNSGNCIRAFGETLALDDRGILRVAAVYTESRRNADPPGGP